MAERHIEVLGPKHGDDEKKKNKTKEMEEMKETASTSTSPLGPGEVAVKASGMMLTCDQMKEAMDNRRREDKKRKKERRGRVRARKDAVLLTAAVQALGVMPRRIVKGPIFPSFNWVTGTKAFLTLIYLHFYFNF
jgi:hypothetical protein